MIKLNIVCTRFCQGRW